MVFLSWSFFNLVYFALFQDQDILNSHLGDASTKSWLIMLCILARNLCTFYAQSLRTLYDAKYSDDKAVFSTDDRVHKKLGILDLDVIMRNTVPFNKFRQFITEKHPHFDVYINLYMLIQVYFKKLTTLLIKAKTIQQRCILESKSFDP